MECYEIDEGEYLKRVEANQYSVVGRLNIQKVDSSMSTLGLKQRFGRDLEDLKVQDNPIGRGYYHIFLHRVEN